MKFTARICNLGVVDNIGETFAPDCEFTFPETVPVTDAGGSKHPIGSAKIEHKGDHLSAEIVLVEPSDVTNVIQMIRQRKIPMKLWPAIAGGVIARDGKTLTKVAITSVDISASGNSDKTIPPLDLGVNNLVEEPPK